MCFTMAVNLKRDLGKTYSFSGRTHRPSLFTKHLFSFFLSFSLLEVLVSAVSSKYPTHMSVTCNSSEWVRGCFATLLASSCAVWFPLHMSYFACMCDAHLQTGSLDRQVFLCYWLPCRLGISQSGFFIWSHLNLSVYWYRVPIQYFYNA